MKIGVVTAAAWVLASALMIGCGEDAPPPAPPPAGGEHGAPPAGAAPAAGANAGKAGGKGDAAAMPSDLPPLPVRDVQERDFLESGSNRDPFHDYSELFIVKPVVVDPTSKQPQREVLISAFALEELKVVGLISGGTGRVLIADPTGLGWVLRVGDFVGKAEVVHSGGPGGADVAINWRVDRIRDNDVVFIREDPTRSDVQATTRVMSMHSEDELKPDIRTGIRGSRDEDDGPSGAKDGPSRPGPSRGKGGGS